MVLIKEVLEAHAHLSTDAQMLKCSNGQMVKDGLGQYSENLPWLLVTLMDKFEFKVSMALRYGMSAEGLFAANELPFLFLSEADSC